ncbi:MAG: efflux RND transporter periplasmic adaptor subunit [Thermoanaerobaculia bacterium]|nr:efflux RND transporter periplasmic adaptor subunit [Thermoanaerobaculia bacterium]
MKRDEPKRRGLRWAWVAVVVLAAAGVWIGAEALPGGGNWATVEVRDLVLTVPVEGELKAVNSTSLSPPQIEDMWQYKIASLATDGTEVKEGDPVVTFDGTQLQQRLRRTVAERDQAEKELEKKVTDLEIERRDLELQLEQAQARLRKAEFLLEVPDDVIADNQLEEARIDRRLAQLEVDYLTGNLEYLAVREEVEVGTLQSKRDLAASRVQQMQTDLSRLTLRAPRAGTVLIRETWNGDKPKVGDQVWRMQSLAEIPDLSLMEAEGEVAEGDAGRLAVGQTVTFRLDAFPDREYHGTIANIRRAVARKSRSNPAKVVKIKIEIQESDPERLRPGMRLRGTAEIERFEGVPTIPESAVVTGPDGASVDLRTSFGSRQVFPELGRRDDRYFEVVSGLRPGAQVRIARAGGGS